MQGFELVQFIASFGAIVAADVTSVKLQTSSDWEERAMMISVW